jgi:HSP20 family protein
MRYRRMTYRYAVMLSGQRAGAIGDLWQAGRPSVMVAQPHWRPPADVYETPTQLTITLELPGVDEDELELTLFEDAIVVQGERHLACETGGRYHAAEIRQGPFRLEALLPKPVDADAVEAHYDRGLLKITLPKRNGREGRSDG